MVTQPIAGLHELTVQRLVEIEASKSEDFITVIGRASVIIITYETFWPPTDELQELVVLVVAYNGNIRTTGLWVAGIHGHVLLSLHDFVGKRYPLSGSQTSSVHSSLSLHSNLDRNGTYSAHRIELCSVGIQYTSPSRRHVHVQTTVQRYVHFYHRKTLGYVDMCQCVPRISVFNQVALCFLPYRQPNRKRHRTYRSSQLTAYWTHPI